MLGLIVLRSDGVLESVEVDALRPVLERFVASYRASRRYQRLQAEITDEAEAWTARRRLLDRLDAEPSLAPREHIQRILTLAVDFFGLDIGILSRIDQEAASDASDSYMVAACYAPGTDLEPGQKFPLGKTYCSITLEHNEGLAINQMGESEYATHPCYEVFELESYIGVPVHVGGECFGTINFSSANPKRPPFTEADRDLLRLLASRVALSLEQERSTEAQRATQERLEDERQEAQVQAEALIEAKERFLATMSHEIRTPLNAVLGLSHLLNETALGDEQAEYVQGISAAADALLSLINDILDFARIKADKLTFESIPFQLAELLHDLVLVLRPRAEAKGIELRLVLDPAVPDKLIGDPHRLRQVLINLVSNAVKFTEEGGVTVRVVPALGGEGNAVKLQFEVVDTGIGIPPEQHERIFESFTQARSDDARNEGGSGLGLTIVKELVEGQGGEISVSSEEGRGARFVVAMPFQQGMASVAEPKLEGHADLSGLHILLAEDIVANQFVATRMLERWGVTVTLAENGREAVEQVVLQPDAFDLVLMDLQMPEMDGIEATRLIREKLELAELPVMALTASVLAQQRNEVLAAGFNEFILKPFDPVHLSHRIAFLTGRVEEAEQQPVNRAALERYALGDPTFIKELAALFFREVPAKIKTLSEAADAGRWEEVWTLAHQAKSQAAYVGAEVLAESLAEVERLARGSCPEDALPEAKRAELLCRAVESDLGELAQKEIEEHA